jgi:hypothetical protein
MILGAIEANMRKKISFKDEKKYKLIGHLFWFKNVI